MTTQTQAADRHTVVTTGWTNPSNAYATSGNDVYATAAPGKNSTIDGDFGMPSLGLPAGATITAVRIVVEWGMTASVAGGVLGVQGRNNGTADSAAEVTMTAPTIAEQQQTFTFGTLPSVTDLNTAGRVVARIRCSKANTNTAMTGNLDFVRFEVDYTAGTTFTKSVGGGITPAGAKVLQAQKPLAAGVTPAGAYSGSAGGGGADYATVMLALNPIAYWRMGEASGTLINANPDGTHNYNAFTTNGPTYGVTGLLTGDSDTALSFASASSQYGQVNSAFALGATFALLAWFKPTTVVDAVLLSAHSSAFLRVQADGSIQFRWLDSGAVQRTLTTAAGEVVAGNTYFLVALYDGTTARIYKNGSQVTSTASFSGGAIASDVWSIARHANLGLYVNGVLDELAIVDGGVSASDVTALYNAGTGAGGTTQSKSLAGGITPTAARTKLTAQKKTAGVTPSAGVTHVKAAMRAFTAGLTPTGARASVLLRRLIIGAVTPTGTVATTKVLLRAYVGAIASAGSLLRQVRKTITGAIASTGAIVKQIARRLTAGLTPTGAVATTKLLIRAYAGGLTTAGALTRRTVQALSGAIGSNGALQRQIARILVGTLTTAGVLRRALSRALAGALSPAGTVSPLSLKARAFAGSITPSGALQQQLRRSITGSITAAGTLAKVLQRRFTAAIASSGTTVTVKAFLRSMAGTVTPAGAIVRRTSKTLTATLAPVGTVVRQVAKRLTGTLSSAGAYSKQKLGQSIALAGTLAPTGSVRRSVLAAFGGLLVPVGVMAKGLQKLLGAALSLGGQIVNAVFGPPTGTDAVLQALRDLLAAADPTMRVDTSGSQPFFFEADTLYLWETDERESAVSASRQDFSFIAVACTPDGGEQARQISDRAVTLLLEARADALMNALRSNQQGTEWDYLSAVLDSDYVTTYGMRGFAIRLSGYRLG